MFLISQLSGPPAADLQFARLTSRYAENALAGSIGVMRLPSAKSCVCILWTMCPSVRKNIDGYRWSPRNAPASVVEPFCMKSFIILLQVLSANELQSSYPSSGGLLVTQADENSEDHLSI